MQTIRLDSMQARLNCDAAPMSDISKAGSVQKFILTVNNMTLKTLKTWLTRHNQRAQLAQLSEHILKDIGITKAEAMREANKRFWEA